MDSLVLVNAYGSKFLQFSPGWLLYPLFWVTWCAPARVCPGRCGGEDPFLFISVLWRAGSTPVQCFQFQAVSWKISACSAKLPLEASSAAQHLLSLSLLFSPPQPGVQSPWPALQQGFSGWYEDTPLFSGLLLGDHCPIDPVLFCKFSQVFFQL